MSDKPPGRTLSEAEQAIVRYLAAHPDFFNRHPDLVEGLRIHHPCRPAVSLLEHQVQVLRQRHAHLHNKLQELVEVARENGRLIGRLQRLTLALLDARMLPEMLRNIQLVLREEFRAEFIMLRLTAPAWQTGWDEELRLSAKAHSLFEALLRAGRPVCGRLTREQTQVLFGGAAAEVASVALAPLQGNDWQGLLAVGSRDELRFHPGMGTLILSCMGELISHALQAYLPRPVATRSLGCTGEGGD